MEDIFEKLEQIKNNYEPNLDLANNVIQKINQRESTVTFKKPTPKWVWCVVCAVLVAIAFAVIMSVHFTKSDTKITIYSAESIEFEKIDDLENFINENDLDCRYFDNKNAFNNIALIKDTRKNAYFIQTFEGIGENGFDNVELKVVLLQNSEFEFYNDFNNLEEILSVSEIEIKYNFEIVVLNNSFQYKAKFIFEDKQYFLEIDTYDSGTEVLEKYIKQLIN